MRPWTRAAALLILLALPLAAVADDGPPEQPEAFGWVERVLIGSEQVLVKAKLDSGALTSSLDAREIEEFRRDGERWVRFELHGRDSGKIDTIERPVKRFVRIVRHSGNHQRRPVIEMELCLGNRQHDVEFTLIDRSNFIYAMLLGRRALEGYAVIDPAQTFLQEPGCN